MSRKIEGICRTCHGDLFRGGPGKGWLHIHPDNIAGLAAHPVEPMTEEEMTKLKERTERLMKDLPLISREDWEKSVGHHLGKWRA